MTKSSGSTAVRRRSRPRSRRARHRRSRSRQAEVKVRPEEAELVRERARGEAEVAAKPKVKPKHTATAKQRAESAPRGARSKGRSPPSPDPAWQAEPSWSRGTAQHVGSPVELRGATALITGAAGGLGGHIARALAAEGTSLVISDLPGEPSTLGLRSCSSGGAGHRTRRGPPRPRAARRAGLQRGGGGGPDRRPRQQRRRRDDRAVRRTSPTRRSRPVLDVNLLAPMELIRQAVPGMIERGRGHVVSIASLAGKIDARLHVHLRGDQGGLIALTQSLRAEHLDDPVGLLGDLPGLRPGSGNGGADDRGRDGVLVHRPSDAARAWSARRWSARSARTCPT